MAVSEALFWHECVPQALTWHDVALLYVANPFFLCRDLELTAPI
jgi:hypothetical protein